MAEVRVVGIRVEQPANQPVLLLRETAGDRYLPIWIGQTEANAIILEQQGVEPVRPLTHDLFRDVIGALGRALKEVRIVDLQAPSTPTWSSTTMCGCRPGRQTRWPSRCGWVSRSTSKNPCWTWRAC